MKTSVHGIHHLTAIASDAQENLNFYAGVLGMRLVKKSVNQDVPGTYHLFYADGAGTPGTDITFFPWPNLPRREHGAGSIVEVPLAVPPGSLDYWRDRLVSNHIIPGEEQLRFGERRFSFEDPHGLSLSFVETGDQRAFEPWEKSPVPIERQVRGLHAVRCLVWSLGPTESLLTDHLGFSPLGEDGEWFRFGVDGGVSGNFIELKEVPTAQRAMSGTGAVHHVAWRVADSDEQMAVRESVMSARIGATPQIDRFWFKSVYFSEPGGVLFELATDGPGFDRDEKMDSLGEQLILPPWLEPQRKEIEAQLPPLVMR